MWVIKKNTRIKFKKLKYLHTYPQPSHAHKAKAAKYIPSMLRFIPAVPYTILSFSQL